MTNEQINKLRAGDKAMGQAREHFFVPDRDNPSFGWLCVWEYLEGKRIAKPLDYIYAATWRRCMQRRDEHKNASSSQEEQ